jgi:hypothetical protein|eukprot:COSAG01_NODE_1020_length_12097_cov_3.014919_4_plen_87_part_00
MRRTTFQVYVALMSSWMVGLLLCLRVLERRRGQFEYREPEVRDGALTPTVPCMRTVLWHPGGPALTGIPVHVAPVLVTKHRRRNNA